MFSIEYIQTAGVINSLPYGYLISIIRIPHRVKSKIVLQKNALIPYCLYFCYILSLHILNCSFFNLQEGLH